MDTSQPEPEIGIPLIDLAVGGKGRIVSIRPSSNERLDRLASYGVFPGTVVQLHQRRPTFIVKIGETDLAIDRDIARDILVQALHDNGSRD